MSRKFVMYSCCEKLLAIPEYASSSEDEDEEELEPTPKRKESFELLDFIESPSKHNRSVVSKSSDVKDAKNRAFQEETMLLSSQHTAVPTPSPKVVMKAMSSTLKEIDESRGLFLSQETACSSNTGNHAISQDLLSPLPQDKYADLPKYTSRDNDVDPNSTDDEDPFIELPIRKQWEGQMAFADQFQNRNQANVKEKHEGIKLPQKRNIDVIDLAEEDEDEMVEKDEPSEENYEVLHSNKRPVSTNEPDISSISRQPSNQERKTFSDQWFDSSKNKNNKKLKQATLFDLMK